MNQKRQLVALALVALPSACATVRAPASPRSPRGTLEVRCPPGTVADVIVDDWDVGPVLHGVRDLSLAAGLHRVEVRGDGYFSQYATVTVRTGETLRLPISLRPALEPL